MSNAGRTLLYSTIIIGSGFSLLYFTPSTDKYPESFRDNTKREQLISVMRRAAGDQSPLYRESPAKIAQIQRKYIEKDQSSESNK